MEGKNANQTQPLINEIEDFEMTNAITIETVSEASLKELVTFWNAHHADKPISKFADRKTAERRITELLKRLEESAPAQVETDAPVFKPRAEQKPEPEVAGENQKPEDEITEEEALAEIRAAAAKRKEEAEKKGAKSGLTLGDAISKSWEDPEVAAARATRNGVTVTVNGITNEFGSVRKAFAALGLPDSKHIRFRGKLKAAKEMVFDWAGQSYLFKVI